jgi:hypothetical protein
MGGVPQDSHPITLNGNIFIMCRIMKCVVTSAAEARLGALFIHSKDAKVIRLILAEMGHKQPPDPIHCDNKTAVDIANDTVRRNHRLGSTEINLFWVTDQVKKRFFDVQYHPGQENLGDNLLKHVVGQHHTTVRPWNMLTQLSQRVLQGAQTPNALRGCTGTTYTGYFRFVPLLQVLRTQSWAPMTSAA